jgi:hypothetical protein
MVRFAGEEAVILNPSLDLPKLAVQIQVEFQPLEELDFSYSD